MIRNVHEITSTTRLSFNPSSVLYKQLHSLLCAYLYALNTNKNPTPVAELISCAFLSFFRWFSLLLLLSTLTGCFDWIRAYRTYLQMDEFDEYFEIIVTDEFNLYFKEPILYSDDFISLARLQPSIIRKEAEGESWRYIFRKIDEQGGLVQPEVKFYFDLDFNEEERLIRWSFSPLFLQIAPAEFLEVSLRSLGVATINEETRQLRANMDMIDKISAELPNKAQVITQLGAPLSIKDKAQQEQYRYHFLLETHDIEKGYEDRALCVIKLTFDKKTASLVKMAGRFAGLKISIDYRKYLDNQYENLAQLIK